MDDFLVKMFEQEQEKIAAADLGEFMDTLPANELEEFLGLTKSAVAGPAEAELPDSENGELDKAQKRVDDYAAKTQGQEPPTRKESEEAGPVSHQGPGKEAKEEKTAASVLRLQKVAAAMHQKEQGQTKTALAPLIGGLAGYYSQGNPEATPKSGFWRGAGLGTLGSIAGAVPGMALRNPALAQIGALGGAVGGGILGGKSAKLGPEERKAYVKQKAIMQAAKAKDLAKESQGPGEEGSSEAANEEGMENTAAAKAKIAMRVMKMTAGAPPHIKQAAAAFAGQEISKLSGCMTKTDEFTSPKAKAKAKIMSAAMEMGKDKGKATRKKMVSFAGKQI